MNVYMTHPLINFFMQDLVGRGYSDGPANVDYDASLYVGQLCMLLTSLPDWSGSFDIIGYSLGGVIATTFASYFPHRLDNLLLISPAGLIKSNKLPLLETLIDSRQIPISFGKLLISNGITSSKFLNISNLVNWQISQHQGFVYSFTVGVMSWKKKAAHTYFIHLLLVYDSKQHALRSSRCLSASTRSIWRSNASDCE